MNEDKLLLEEYRNLHQERWERSRRTWITLSIFMAGSFLLVLEAMKNREGLGIGRFLGISGFLFLMIIAIVLIVFSWFVEFTTIRHNDSALERIIEIEKELNFKVPENRHRREQRFVWFRIRKNAWHLVFFFLICTYLSGVVLFHP